MGACSLCKHRKTKCEFIPEENACRTCIAKGLASECVASRMASRTRSLSRRPHTVPSNGVQESRHPDDKTRGRFLTRSTHSETESKKSGAYSHAKGSHSKLQQSENHMQAVEEVEPMSCTHQERQQKQAQTANRKVSAVPEDEEVSEEQITLFATAMQPCRAHKKAQDFFKDPDSDSEDFDGYESSASDGLDEELKSDDAIADVQPRKKPHTTRMDEELESDDAITDVQPRKKPHTTRKVSSKHSTLAKGKEKPPSTQRDDDPKTCSESMTVHGD